MANLKDKLEKINALKETIKTINLSEEYNLLSIPLAIQECVKLEKLDISFTGVRLIPDFVFQLPKLKTLSYLNCEKLEAQPTGLGFAKKLQNLSIEVNSGQTIPEELYGLSGLKSLTIGGEISEFPKRICELSDLEELDFFDTKINSMPKEIQALSKLKKVSFFQSLWGPDSVPTELKLSEIFKNLSQCSSLTHLKLEMNGIKEIPANISELKGLTYFSARYNNLTELPREIFHLTNLTELDLSINQIKELPVGIENLKSLKTLKLNANWDNKLDTKNLFSVIERLENLENLHLENCQSSMNIPESISSLKNLRKFDISNNLVSKLPESISTMTHLKLLRIATNDIPETTVKRLKETLTTTDIM
jgi:Leucine-rich repeat (LRR) protein